MRKILLALLLMPLAALSAISDWDYMPFISYTDQYPSDVIKKGRNFDFLQTLWNKPQSLSELKKSGFNFADVDTTLLIRQGMVYCKDGNYYSAIPFIDSLAIGNLRDKALSLAENIINDTKPEMQAFLSTLDKAGYRESAFPLVHSLVFDDIIWDYLNVSPENATINPVDSMTWRGVFYFYRPEVDTQYGTNGMGLGDNHRFYFSWGNNSNAYLCTCFIQTKVIKALKCMLNGEELTPEMEQDCKKFGVLDDNDRLTIPVLDGQDATSKAADLWSKAAAASFSKHFDGENIADIIGWSCDYNDAACKVILYHEVLSAIDRTLDESGLLPIPEILKSTVPADKKQTATVAYISKK